MVVSSAHRVECRAAWINSHAYGTALVGRSCDIETMAKNQGKACSA